MGVHFFHTGPPSLGLAKIFFIEFELLNKHLDSVHADRSHTIQPEVRIFREHSSPRAIGESGRGYCPKFEALSRSALISLQWGYILRLSVFRF
jgi:hypothetical protein